MNKQLSIRLYVMILIITVSCSSPVPQTVTASGFPSTTIISTSTFLSPSATLTLTQSPPDVSTSLTPFPVLSEKEAEVRLLELLHNNAGCQLPCFLGYTPGITTPEEMDQFFNQFVASDSSDIVISKPRGQNTQAVRFYFLQEDRHFNAGISAWKNQKEITILGMGTFLTGQTEHPWSPSYYETMNYYLLPQTLVNYGVPSQVLVLTFRDDRQRPDITTNEFFLVLLYHEQGMYLKYKMARQTIGSSFVGCPSKSFVDIAVWNPKDKEAFDQVVQIMNNGGDLSSYKLIDEATSMSLDEFYQIFLNPDDTRCIETPVEIWPNP